MAKKHGSVGAQRVARLAKKMAVRFGPKDGGKRYGGLRKMQGSAAEPADISGKSDWCGSSR